MVFNVQFIYDLHIQNSQHDSELQRQHNNIYFYTIIESLVNWLPGINVSTTPHDEYMPPTPAPQPSAVPQIFAALG